jgi:hypothetical protein
LATAEGWPRPALLSRFVPENLDDDPGSTLIVRGIDQEIAAVTHWLSTGAGSAGYRLIPRASTVVEMPRWLSPVLSLGGPSNGPGRPGLREVQILRGLVAGACVLRSASEDEAADSTWTVRPEDYESVRQLLQCPILTPADVPSDPLAADMVNRANVYLAAKSGQFLRHGRPSAPDYDDVCGQNGRPARELITRRELTDLGNVRSGAVRRLVEYLRRERNGYEWYYRLGLVSRPPELRAWARIPVDRLLGLLRSWSFKQVRNHFDRLRRDGLITAERAHRNSPWRYELPEELTDVSSPFGDLPPTSELVNPSPTCDDTPHQ